MENNILCQRKEQVAVTGFFENVSKILKECDECSEKERIKEILHHMNDTVSYIFLGEEAVGKTELLKALFKNILELREEGCADICEYRYGEQAFTTQAVNGYQKKFIPAENLRGISVIDTKGVCIKGKNSLEQIVSLTQKCETIFVVMDVKKINNPALWDVLEKFSTKNMLFLLTKCDLVSLEELNKNRARLRTYMDEAGIQAPVFAVSALDDEADGLTTMDELRIYIRETMIGRQPIIDRQIRNIEETRQLLEKIQQSYVLRKKQYDSDVAILHKIDEGLNSYIVNQEKVINTLISKVIQGMNEDIDAYQNEIISKMDPYKIRERFQSKDEFADYLTMVNENYKNIMTESVNRKTIEAIKSCLHELEIVFEDAVGFFNERENILALNDRFYGSLAATRKDMVSETRENALAVSQYYQTLSEASDKLFLQIWEERKKYDKKIATERTLTTVGGGMVGAAGGAALAVKTLGTFAAAASAGAKVLLLLGYGSLVIIGTIVTAALLRELAKALYEPKAGEQMEEVARCCIEQFKEEVDRTRKEMIKQVTLQIEDIFKKELSAVDGYFAPFRMSVNIDEKKLPLLEANLSEIETLLYTIDHFE